MSFKVLELCINFYLKHEFFLMYFKIPYDFTILRFYDPFLRSEFVCSFPCRVKIAILTTLKGMTSINKIKDIIEVQIGIMNF